MNITTGIIANKEINLDEAVQIGKKIHQDFDSTKFIDIKFVKAKQTKTSMTMRKSVRVDKDDILMLSNELLQRLMSTVCISGPLEDSIFTYELVPVAPVMFYDDGTTRKNKKSLLMQYLLNLATDSREIQENIKAVAFDGGALILPWPKIGTMETVCGMYVDLLTCSNPRNVLKVVVLDNYEVATTKDHEKKRCHLQSDYSAEVSVTSNNPIPGNKSAFLYNQRNKQSFINILGRSLERNDITLVHAKDMGDADVTIIKEPWH